MLRIDERLKNLAEVFSVNNENIYAVGGYVRNQLLGLPVTDIDVAGTATPEQVIKMLSCTNGCNIIERNRALGTIEIHIYDGVDKLKCEYTTFRRDSYRGGVHTPVEVSFTRNIDEDALRRDFTVNAIYADLLTGSIIDPACGMADLKKRRLQTVSPSVFSEDGLRILRMIRFAAQLDWDIEESALASAKENAALLEDISRERIFEELKLILTADEKYPIPKRRGLGFHLMQMLKCGIDRHIFSGADISETEISLCSRVTCELTLRFAALLSGSGRAWQTMSELKAPKQLTKDVVDIVNSFRTDAENDCDIKKLLINIGGGNAERLIELNEKAGRKTDKLSAAYGFLKERELLNGIKGLKVSGFDCIERGLTGEKTGKALDTLLFRAIKNEIPNSRDRLLAELDIIARNESI